MVDIHRSSSQWARRGWLVAGLAAALLALAAVSPARAADAQVSAGAPATNYRTQYLTANPTDGMATASVGRSIYLASGSYEWTVDLGTPAECADPLTCPVKGSRHIWLAAGTYSWNCYLDPRNGTYVEWCTLKTPGYPQASVSSPAFRIPYSGNWTWGGYLFRFSD
jgi:hypothetical protein